MLKLLFKHLLIVILVFSYSYSFAQSIFTPNTQKKASTAPQVTPPMSPEDFSNRVNTLHQQNATQISQELNQQVQPPLAPSTAVHPPAGVNTTSTPAATDNTSISNTPPATTPKAAPSGATVPPTSRSTGAQPQPLLPTPGPTPEPVQQPADTYTGFGGGAQKNSATPSVTPGSSNTGSGSGWDIKY